MTDNMTDDRADGAAIERDIERTQDEMGDTVHKLEEKLNPHDVAQSLIGDDGIDIAEQALDVTRHNPIPVALIAIGGIWLLASSSAPAIERLRRRITGGGSATGKDRNGLIPRSKEPAPIGPPPPKGAAYDRRRSEADRAESSTTHQQER